MASTELEIVRRVSSEFIVQALPDGSAALFEVATKNVYSLNPSAAAAWEACASPAPVAQIATAMSRRLDAPVTEDLAHEAVAELVTAGLATVTSSEGFGTSRRAMLKQVAGVALPVVLVLTGAEQKAHAQGAGSNPPPRRRRTGATPTRRARRDAPATTHHPLNRASPSSRASLPPGPRQAAPLPVGQVRRALEGRDVVANMVGPTS